MPWRPSLGAVPSQGGTLFRVWAPRARSLEVKVLGGPAALLEARGDGYFSARVAGVPAGARYVYRFPDGRERPDPASLSQPDGVHGPSEVIDLAALVPGSKAPATPLERLVFSEIHLGTFTPEGTADAAARKFPQLAEAGFTAVEVMPVAEFPGARNWGYDGVHLFAAHSAYGGPAALSRLVDAAHASGLCAFLDVVYNHLGPEGNYLGEFGPYFTARHKTPWGDALDFSQGPVRDYFIQNALRWVGAQGAAFDGLRLDAIHSIIDDSPKHILRELQEAIEREGRETGRTLHLIAESDLNDPKLVEPKPGYGLSAAWADDFHHALHAALTGERTGYYQDYAEAPVEALASALRQGWHYTGQVAPSRGHGHGKSAAHLPGRRFVYCAQNHDQIGNRARGERLVQLTSPGGLRVAAALLALAPGLPLFFQGEEFAAPEPFLYFVSHGDAALVEAVREGRRAEFKAFAWAGEVPDPQSEETFRQSKLDWSLRESPVGQRALRWHQALLALRREHPALQDDGPGAREAQAREDQGVLLLRRFAGGRQLLLVAALREGNCAIELAGELPGELTEQLVCEPGLARLGEPSGRAFRLLLDSNSPDFARGSPMARLSGTRLELCGRQAVVLEA